MDETDYVHVKDERIEEVRQAAKEDVEPRIAEKGHCRRLATKY